MAHEILSVKLNELDEKIARLHNRIHVSESDDPKLLQQTIRTLRGNCKEEDSVLKDRLKYSKAESIGLLSNAYQDIEHTIRHTQSSIQAQAVADSMDITEEKILLAEYALDFAMQAADHALLCALEAIQSQNKSAERSSK